MDKRLINDNKQSHISQRYFCVSCNQLIQTLREAARQPRRTSEVLRGRSDCGRRNSTKLDEIGLLVSSARAKMASLTSVRFLVQNTGILRNSMRCLNVLRTNIVSKIEQRLIHSTTGYPLSIHKVTSSPQFSSFSLFSYRFPAFE